MSKINMFEMATRTKMRFTYRGQIGVEDLWSLSIENLDSVFKVLNSQLKQVKEESLLSKKTKEDEVLDTKIEIVKYIFTTKLAEREIRLNAQSKKVEKQKLMGILENKQDEELLGKTTEQIQAMIDAL